MPSVEVTLKRTAMSQYFKLNILTNESLRRLCNCSLNISWNEQVEYLNRLMMWGGCFAKQREIVARRVLAKYHNNLNNYREYG